MALGQQNQEFTGKLYLLKIKVQDSEKKKLAAPIFEVSTKGEDGKYAVVNKVSTVSGALFKVEAKKGEYEGEQYDIINVYLKDDGETGNETYLISLKMNMLSRSLINYILGLKTYDDLKISLYQSKKGFASVSVREHGELANWAISLDAMEKPIEQTFKGRVIRDYSPVDNQFVDAITKFAAKLSGNKVENKPDDKHDVEVPSTQKRVKKSVKEVNAELDATDEPLF